MVKKISSALVILIALVFVYTPIIILLIYSFTDSVIIGDWNGFSLELYKKMFKNERLMKIVWDTILLALASASIATVLGTIGAIGIYYSKKRTNKLISGVSRIPIINAEIVTALALALFFALINLERSMFGLITAHVVISAPFVVLSVIPKLKQMDNNLYEAALDLGATPTKALFKVVLPEIIPGVLSGFMLAITLSLDDYIVTAFTKPSTFQTVSTYAYDSIKNLNKSMLPQLRALSAIIFVLMLIVVVLLNFNFKKNKGGKR